MSFSLDDVRKVLESRHELNPGEIALPLWSSDSIAGIGLDSVGRMVLVMRPCLLSENLTGTRFEFLAKTSLLVRELGALRQVSVLFVNQDADHEVDLEAVATVFLGLLEVSSDDSVALSDVIRGLSDLFEAGRLPSLSVQEQIGLAGELLVILGSSNHDYVVSCWRSGDRDRFDFSSHGERVEVKTTTRLDRVHNFSSGQIPGPTDCNVIVASVQLNLVEVGQSLEDLVNLVLDQLSSRVARSELLAKAGVVVGLGRTTSRDIRFDVKSSLSSIRFVLSTKVPRPIQSPGVLRMSWEALVAEFEEPEIRGPLSMAVVQSKF